MPRSKSHPLTPVQQALIYDTYHSVKQPLDGPPISMSYLATLYDVSISVIHRAIHQEAYRRATSSSRPKPMSSTPAV